MATQDNGSGLLSKVARFVLNPTVDWVDLDKPDSARKADSSKVALKQMIERKQYNDAVRKREFDKLRSLRRNPGRDTAPASIGASSFQDSWGYSVFEERANTLKKIDEIEAQMSKQWWKARDGAGAGGLVGRELGAPNSAADAEGMGIDSAFATTMPAEFQPGEHDPQEAAPRSVPSRPPAQTVAAAFSTSVLSEPQGSPDESDAQLEEAAIRFANGDDGGAETVLLAALQTPGAGDAALRMWAIALLDLYRVTQQQASFERVAADFVQRFGAPAPAWRELTTSSAPAAFHPAAGASQVLHWVCPAELDEAALAELRACLPGDQAACHLDWHAVKSIDEGAAETLSQIMADWCEQSLQLQLDGIEALDHLLRLNTPMGERLVGPYWWQMRLDLARMLQLQDEFELLALDYCVTYEMSPPTWREARCVCLDHLGTGNTGAGMLGSTAGEAAWQLRPDGAGNWQLGGELLGDVSALLQALQAALGAQRRLLLLCDELVRVDFSAAGSVLNWLANAQTQGVRLELHQVPALVAAFFQLIGIGEHARIVVRQP